MPVAFVTLVPGAQVSADELLAFARGRVDEPPARPKRVTVLEAMPLTNVGKIYKPALRQMAAKQSLVVRSVKLVTNETDAFVRQARRKPQP